MRHYWLTAVIAALLVAELSGPPTRAEESLHLKYIQYVDIGPPPRPPVVAGELLHPRYRRYSDGVPRDQDYFTAHEDPTTRALLGVVEKWHFSTAFWSLYRSGQFRAVLSELMYVLDKFPNHTKALTLMGAVARDIRRPSLAIAYFQTALALYPQYAITHAQFGVFLTDIGQVEQGVAKLTDAVTMNPDLAIAHAWLATAYYHAGKPELAAAEAEKARQLGYTGPIRRERPTEGGDRR